MRKHIIIASLITLSISTSLYGFCTGRECSSSTCCNTNCCDTNCCSSSFCSDSCCPKDCCNERFCECECRCPSRTTFVARPQFQPGSPEMIAITRDRKDVAEDGHGGMFQIALFGGRSTQRGKLATFFTPFCKTRLTVKQNPDDETDLIARHFNVVVKDDEEKPFESEITFCPRMSVFGIGLEYRQNLNKLFGKEDECDRTFWMAVSAPIERVSTTMGLTEKKKEDYEALEIEGLDQTFYNSMVAAFNQKAWCYGKINGCCDCVKWGLADISLRFGRQWINCDNCIFGNSTVFDAYVGILIPTGTKTSARYVFEPIAGHRRHFGVQWGTQMYFNIWTHKDDCERYVEAVFDNASQYLFSKCEMRSFDLKCKPWSRYMEVYKNREQAEEADALGEEGEAFLSTPGINVFTQCVDVKPRLSHSSNFAFSYTHKKFRGELGYNLYMKQSECVKLCNWKEGPALKANQGNGITNGLQTINNNFNDDENNPADYVDADRELADYEKNMIKKEDINIESATHPCVFSNTVYTNLGWRWDERKRPLFLSFGGSYEFGQENYVMNRYTVWLKGGISF